MIKIGLVAPFEGRYRYIGYDAVYAARLAVREINAAGGIDGIPLELVAYDDRGNVDLAVRAARSLAVDAEVVAVIGHYRDETSAAGGAVYSESHVPHIVVGAYASPSGTTWHLMPSPVALAEAMVGTDTASSTASGAIWGGGPVAETLIELTGSPLRSAQASPLAGVVYSTLAPVEAAEAVTEWRESGATGEVVGEMNMASAAFRDVAGESAIGAWFVTAYPYPEHLPEHSAWITDYLDVGPHVPNPGPYALPSYEAVYLVVEAVREAANAGLALDRENVGIALNSVRREGLLGEIGWDDEAYWHHATLYVYRWTPDGPLAVTPSR
ncbi:MAG: ABC transporter substrate-binding protein [Anaerolineae bacterium]